MTAKKFLQTWRWFGPDDPVTLAHVKQAGAQGIVTALHHIPHGAIWTTDEIKKRQAELRANDFAWSVVESLPVHEDIKTNSGDYLEFIENYKQSLVNLAACGIKIVTYNFMPVNDWTRTDIDFPMADGSRALYFNWTDLAMFDIHILERVRAAEDYPERIVENAAKRFAAVSDEEKRKLIDTIFFGIPGEDKWTIDSMKRQLQKYEAIDRAALKENLAYFLREVAPVADDLGIRLAIHPDDPPFDILGLPRIVSTGEDLLDIKSFSDAKANGFCFCTGSLGANPANDLPEMIKELGSRIHFFHFRNVRRDAEGNFYEADHLDGDVDMYRVLKEAVKIQQASETPIPFRPDHGHQMLDDLNKRTNPGYSAIGRLRGLAELRGLEMGILGS